MKSLCIAYLIALSYLLLTDQPLRFFGIPAGLPRALGLVAPMAHFLSFLVLGVLAMAARWPVPRWSVALSLVVYAGGTEVFQTLVPRRSAELGDWLQDLAGIVVGAMVCWGAAGLWYAVRGGHEGSPRRGKGQSDDPWETFRHVSASGGGRRNWWS